MQSGKRDTFSASSDFHKLSTEYQTTCPPTSLHAAPAQTGIAIPNADDQPAVTRGRQ